MPSSALDPTLLAFKRLSEKAPIEGISTLARDPELRLGLLCIAPAMCERHGLGYFSDSLLEHRHEESTNVNACLNRRVFDRPNVVVYSMVAYHWQP